MERATATRSSRLSAVMREGKRVKPLELLFDLIFVLGDHPVHGADGGAPDMQGLAEGTLVLALLWWAWTGYGG
jgi:low temperature requirement protein LtrA